MASEASPGYFGKVPILGDFISRRLPHDFVDPWDRWLRSALSMSRQQLAEDWLDYYLASPIWRFAFSAEVVGTTPCGGIMMPSVDKAGRYFPFTLVTFLPTNANLFQMAVSSHGWFESAETVALSVLDETPPEMEALDQEIVALGLLGDSYEDESDIGAAENVKLDREHLLFPMQSVDGIAEIFPAMAKRLTDQQFGAYSLWWTSGSEQIEPAMLMCQGLPPASGYAAMISGGWLDHGWDASASTPDSAGTQ